MRLLATLKVAGKLRYRASIASMVLGKCVAARRWKTYIAIGRRRGSRVGVGASCNW